MNFLFVIKLSDFFYKVQISKNYEKNILKLVVLSIAIARHGTILLVLKVITRIKRYTHV